MAITLDGTTGITTPDVLLNAGTASVAPLTFTSGTNLTTATAGSMEYDGRVPYFTPLDAQRGVVPGMQYFRLDSALVGTATTSAQTLFGVGCTLSASTVYEFQMMFVMSKSATSLTHTISLGFAGTATVNNILYFVNNLNNNAPMPASADTTTSMSAVASTTATIITENFSSLNQVQGFTVNGTVSINSGGTFIPQYTTSAITGPYSVLAGSFIRIYPISASGSNTSVGTWA